MYFVAIKIGRRQGARSGASRTTFYTPGTLGLEGNMKVVRDVTDEQRRRRPIFIATLRAGASWPFFLRCSLGPSRSIFAPTAERPYSKRQKWGGMGARSRLEKQPTDFRQNICYSGDRTLGDSVLGSAKRTQPWTYADAERTPDLYGLPGKSHRLRRLAQMIASAFLRA